MVIDKQSIDHTKIENKFISPVTEKKSGNKKRSRQSKTQQASVKSIKTSNSFDELADLVDSYIPDS